MPTSWLMTRQFKWAIGFLLLWVFFPTLPSHAQDYKPGLLMVVLPDSVLPLAFLDTAGPPVTNYPCLNTLDSTYGYLGLYKVYPHRDFRLEGTYCVVFPDTADIDSLAAAYLASGCVVSASGMPTVQYDALPNDPLFLNAGGNPSERQWALDAYHSRVDQAWDITTGDSDLVIAVVDEGVFWEHPDLINNMWINAAEDINHNGTFECWPSTLDSNGVTGDKDYIDNDNNGYPDDVVGIKVAWGGFDPDVTLFQHDYYPDIDSTLDSALYHGTFVASIIAGRTNNGVGAAGAAGGWGQRKGIKIMAAVNGEGSIPGFVNAVKYAIDAGADIINMSWGFPYFAEKPWEYWLPTIKKLDSLLASAYSDSNIICVAAAGNEGGYVVKFPASFGQEEYYQSYPYELLDYDRVLGIGSLDSLNARCSSSNYGVTLYDFGAPGWNWGARVKGTPDSLVYDHAWSGCDSARCATSWSAPVASAIAALVWSAMPELDNGDIIGRLRAGHSPNNGFNAGNIDAFEPMVEWPTPVWEDTLRLYGDVVVPVGETLWVNPGAFVKVPGKLPGCDYANQGTDTSKVEIIVNGTLIARGTDSLPIRFHADPSGGHDEWAGIKVQDGGKVILDHVIIENAICGVKFDAAGVCSLRAVTVNQCQSFGIDVASQNVSVRGSRISDIADGYGIRVNSGAKVNLYADTIQNAYGGIEFFATRPCSLQASVIESCQVHGIYTQSDSLAISWTTIHDIANGTGIAGEGATADLYRCYVYRCPVGMSLDLYSGGKVTFSRFGDGVEGTASVGLSLNCPVYLWQTLIDGPFTSAGVKVAVENALIYECKIDGHGTGHYGLWATLYSSPKVRCTQVVGQSSRGIYGYKAYMDLGKNQAGEYGNNSFDTVAAYAIESAYRVVMAERNFFSKYCTPTPPPDSCEFDTCPPWVQILGPVDYDPWLRCRPDSCSFMAWDTTGPPGNEQNRLVAQQPRSEDMADLNYPNPFNPSTVIRYSLSRNAEVKVSIINIMGQEVRVLADQVQTAGLHELLWDGKDGRGQSVASGVYFYRVQTGGQTQSRKMVLLR